jgi:uncharacterized protein (TIGR04255 family)
MFNLDPVTPYKLSNPPLVQALAQVRFPLVAKINTYEGIAPLQDALFSEFPFVQKVSEALLTVSIPVTETQPQETISWHFTDEEERLFVVNANSATLSLGTQYESVADFATRFKTAISALSSVYSIRRCERIGVRFLDVVPDINGEGDWKNWFNGNVVGWAASEIVHGNTDLQASVSQIQLSSPPIDELSIFPADVQAVIRHGVAPRGSVMPGFPPTTLDDRSFFLDMDLYVTGNQDFDTSSIDEQVRGLQAQIDRFFRWTLTKDGDRNFGLEEK